MCTVTYIPTTSGAIITHNRDEKLTRLPSELPKEHLIEGKRLYFPKDKNKNGTWFCTDDSGRTACILNGAFEKHVSQPPYKKSRGIVVLDAFQSTNFKNWIKEYDFENIEPFTLILIESNKELLQFKWDGSNRHVLELDPNANHIWSSATLYSKEAVLKRENWLYNWLSNEPKTAKSLFSFHNYGGDGNESTNLKMEIRGSHQTVSITQLAKENDQRIMHHSNFSTHKESTLEF